MSGRRSSRLSNAPAIIRTTIRARARRSSMVLRRAPWPRCRSRSRTASWRWRNRSPAASALFRAESGLARERRGGKRDDQDSHAKRVRRRHRGGWDVRGFGAADDRAGLGNAGAGTDAGDPSAVHAGDRRAAEKSGGRQLADVPPHLRRLGLQPARRDHARQCRPAATGLELRYRPDRGPRGAAGREQRGYVRRHAGNQLLALEARTGKVLWRYKRPFPEDMTPLHPTSRGVGLYGDKVYFAAAEA